MKKTLITLLALAGISDAAETTSKTYVYTGYDYSTDWLEYKPNWVEKDTENILGSSGNLTATETRGNKFVVETGTTAKCGKNANFVEGTLQIEKTASAEIQGNSKFTDSTMDIAGGLEFASGGITLSGNTMNVASGGSLKFSTNGLTVSGGELNIASGGSLTLASNVKFVDTELTVHGADISITSEDVKLRDTTLNVLSGEVAFKKTWFDNGSDSDNGITINLAEGAKVSFSESVMSSDWNSTITLSTTFSNGYVQNGTGDVIWTKVELIDFGTRHSTSTATLSDYLTNGYFKGDSFKVNGSALTLGSFDTSALTAEDVGKYQFAVEGNKLMVQYAAYSQSIPEPTTATLSLLALCGLAARRRRK